MSLTQRDIMTESISDRPEAQLRFYEESTLFYILRHIFRNIGDRGYKEKTVTHKDLYETWEEFRKKLEFEKVDEGEEGEEGEEGGYKKRNKVIRTREDLLILSKQFSKITNGALFLVKDSQPYMIKYEPKPNKNIINSEMLQEYLKDNDKRILVRSIANDKTLNLTFKSDDIVLDRYCDLSKISFPLLRQRNSEDPEVTDFTTCLDEIYANPKKAETQSKSKLKKSNFYIYRHSSYYNPIIITTLIENFIMRSKYWILVKQDEEDEENKYLNLRKVQKIFSKFKFEFFKKFPELKTIIKEVHLKLLEFKDTNSNNYERIYFTLKFSLHDTDDRRNKDNKNNNSKNNEKDGDKNGLTHEKEERISLLQPKIKLFYEYLNSLLEKQKFKIEPPQKVRFNNLVCFQVYISTELKSSLKISNEIDIFNKFLSKYGELVYCDLSFNFKNDKHSKIHVFHFLVDLQTDNVPYKSWNYTQDKPYPIYANNELPDDRCATALSLEIVISSPLVYCTKCLLIGHYHEDCPYFGECQICGDAASKEKESNDGITENGEDDYDDDNEDDHEEDKKDDVDGEDIDVVRSTTKNNEPYEYKFSDDDEEEGEEEEEEGEEEEGEGEENADNEAQEESVSHNFFMCPKTTKQDVIDVIKKVPPIVFFDEDGNFSPFSQMYEIECRKLWGSK